MTQIVGFGLNQGGPAAGLWMRSGVSYRAALLALLPTYAWIAEDLAAGAVAAWPCAVTGVEATQATAEARPTQSATALNGRPGLTFDGGDALVTAAFASALAQPTSIVIALRYDGGSGVRCAYDGATGARHSLFVSTTWRIFAGSTADSGYPPASGGVAVMRSTYNGAASTVVRNGTQIGGTLFAGTQALGGFSIGRLADTAAPFIGIIADILIFSGTDDAARAEAADALMRAYYGI